MTAEASQGVAEVRERADVSDAAEQTQNGVVSPTEIEGRHVGAHELARRISPSGDANEDRIQIQPIDCECMRLGQGLRVPTRSASDIENRSSLRLPAADQSRERCALGLVILPRPVNEVVELT
jgi:hypothetical protein